MTKPLTLGAPIAVHPQGDPLDDMIWADQHEAIEGAWLIDHLQGWFPEGVTTKVLPEPHQLLDPLSVLAAGATRTHRIPLGVAVTDPVRRSSVALAQSASTIGWLGQRPMRLGLGVGDPGQLQPFDLPSGPARTGRLDYIRPALRHLTALRDEGEITPEGASLGITSVSPYALYVAAHGPQMIKLAARYGDGWMPSSLPPTIYRDRLADLRRHAEEFGRDPDQIRPTMFIWTALGTSEAESDRLLQDPSVRAVALFRGPKAFADHGGTYPLDHGYLPHLVDPAGAKSMLASIPDGVVREGVLHGSPEQVREKLQAYNEAGCEHVVCYDIGRFVDPEGTERFREALLQVAKL